MREGRKRNSKEKKESEVGGGEEEGLVGLVGSVEREEVMKNE